jgi:hypothetical protein
MNEHCRFYFLLVHLCPSFSILFPPIIGADYMVDSCCKLNLMGFCGYLDGEAGDPTWCLLGIQSKPMRLSSCPPGLPKMTSRAMPYQGHRRMWNHCQGNVRMHIRMCGVQYYIHSVIADE